MLIGQPIQHQWYSSRLDHFEIERSSVTNSGSEHVRVSDFRSFRTLEWRFKYLRADTMASSKGNGRGVWFSERIENEASSNKERCFRYRERHKGTVTRPIITMSTEPGVAISGNGPADAAMQTLAFNVTFSSCERVAWLLVVTSVAATHTSWLPSSYLFFPLLRAFHRVSPQHRCPRFYDSIVISIGRFVGNWKKKKFFFSSKVRNGTWRSSIVSNLLEMSRNLRQISSRVKAHHDFLTSRGRKSGRRKETFDFI